MICSECGLVVARALGYPTVPSDDYDHVMRDKLDDEVEREEQVPPVLTDAEKNGLIPLGCKFTGPPAFADVIQDDEQFDAESLVKDVCETLQLNEEIMVAAMQTYENLCKTMEVSNKRIAVSAAVSVCLQNFQIQRATREICELTKADRLDVMRCANAMVKMQASFSSPSIIQLQPAAKRTKESADGFVWKVNDIQRLKRFLCLGCEEGTYDVEEKELLLENAMCLVRLLEQKQGVQAVEIIREYSEEGRAAKQNPIIFSLAFFCRQNDDPDVKSVAYKALPKICKIPTHLFQFLNFCEKVRCTAGKSWGSSHKHGVANWYLQFRENPLKLAQHVTICRSSNGWTHTDVVRMSHVKPDNDSTGTILAFVAKGLDYAMSKYQSEDSSENLQQILDYLEATERCRKAEDISIVLDLIRTHGLVREHIPTQYLNSADVWSALLQKMPMTAMIRNLGKMSSIQLLGTDRDEYNIVVSRLNDEKILKQAKIHPFNVLVALKVYERGCGEKGTLTWTKNQRIVDALNSAFYKSFKLVEPTNKSYLIALNVSGSMSYGSVIGSSITPREAAASMAMVAIRTEKKCKILGFSHTLIDIPIKASMNLEEVVKLTSGLPSGSTDCALPMIHAKKYRLDIDVFVVFTDNEIYFGKMHPSQALKQYRASSGKWNAKLIVVAMTATGFSIADPDDPGMLDMSGFDSAAPEVMRNFVLEKI